MNSRNIRGTKKGAAYNTNTMDVFIERLKKIRALNGDPALFGLDNYILKKMQRGLNMLTRSS